MKPPRESTDPTRLTVKEAIDRLCRPRSSSVQLPFRATLAGLVGLCAPRTRTRSVELAVSQDAI